MVFEAFPMVFETVPFRCETKTAASRPKIIVVRFRKTVSRIRKLFCFATTMINHIGTIMYEKNAMVQGAGSIVTAVKKTGSVVQTMIARA